MGYHDLVQHSHIKLNADDGQSFSAGSNFNTDKTFSKTNIFSLAYQKLKHGNKQKMLWIFVGFLLLKLFIVSMIFLVPRVVEHLRT